MIALLSDLAVLGAVLGLLLVPRWQTRCAMRRMMRGEDG